MKNMIAMLLVAVMALSMAACTGSNNTDTTTTPATTTPATTTPATTAPQVQGPASALEALTNTWALFGEDEKFFVGGGDYNNMVMDAPGAVDLTVVDYLTGTLLVPEAQVAGITECASLMHGMIANNFTCGAFKVSDVNAFATAMKDAIKNNQWICGMPEKMTIVDLGGSYVVVAFGINDAMNPFFTKLANAYPGATTLVDEAIA